MRLLDTNVLAKWGNPDTAEQVVPYLQTHANDEFVTSSLVVFEFFRPASRRDQSRQVRDWLGRTLDSIEPFSEGAGLQAATVEAQLARHNEGLPVRDLLIASHARTLDATFVTCDKDDFEAEPIQQLLDVDIITTT